MTESQNTEWKQSWHDEYFKWVCGYANAQGGKLFGSYEIQVGKQNLLTLQFWGHNT